jgi:hypothetical protein
MAILIKRFKVRYNGVTYGPGEPGGEILYGLSQDEEDKLIAGANGTIERYIEPQLELKEEKPKQKARKPKSDLDIEKNNDKL